MNEYILKVREKTWEKPLAACVVTFGCQLNFSDGEKLCGLFGSMGFGLTDERENADVILLNTCAVRGTAENRVFGNIGFLKHLKEKNPALIIGLCGCMAEEKHIIDKIRKSYPYVDIIFGTSAMDELPRLLYAAMCGERGNYHEYGENEYVRSVSENFSARRDSGFKALVPVMYGCDNFCSYCIVPYVRGRERSRGYKAVLSEIRQLAERGYKEITLLGQNVNSYAGGVTFPELLRKINALDGDFIVRFMSSHPKDAGRDLIDAIIECEKVAKHLHLPFQSGSDGILEAMNRSYKIRDYLEIVRYAREKIPGFSFGTDVIVGFPGETDAQFRETLDVLKTVKFDSVYSFIYSPRAGTKAAELEEYFVPDKEKSARMTELLALQREISVANLKRFIGRTVRVLAEEETEDGRLRGKCNEFIMTEFEHGKIGEFCEAKIKSATNWAIRDN